MKIDNTSKIIQTDMYHSKPWVPENVSPSVASFVSSRPTFGSESSTSSSRKPTQASAHTSYSQYAISGERRSWWKLTLRGTFQANPWSSTATDWRTRSPSRRILLSTSPHHHHPLTINQQLPISALYSGKPSIHSKLDQ